MRAVEKRGRRRPVGRKMGLRRGVRLGWIIQVS